MTCSTRAFWNAPAADPFPNQRQDDLRPPAIMVDGEEEWEVERILRERVRGRQRQVLVK